MSSRGKQPEPPGGQGESQRQLVPISQVEEDEAALQEQAERDREVGKEVKKILGDQSTSTKVKIKWAKRTITANQKAVSEAGKRARDLEQQNTELWDMLNELATVHDRNASDNNENYSRVRRLQDTLRDARQLSRQNHSLASNAEEANVRLRELADRQGEMLENSQSEERYLRDVVFTRNQHIQDLQGSLDRAAGEVMDHRQQMLNMEREGTEWTAKVHRYVEALQQENNYLREQVNRSVGTGHRAEYNLAPRVLSARYDPRAARERLRNVRDAKMTEAPPGEFYNGWSDVNMEGLDEAQNVRTSGEAAAGSNSPPDRNSRSPPTSYGSPKSSTTGSSSRSTSPSQASQPSENPFMGWRDGKGVSEKERRSRHYRSMGREGQPVLRRTRRRPQMSSDANPTKNYPFDAEEDEEVSTLMKGLDVKADGWNVKTEFVANTTTEIQPVTRVLPRQKEKKYSGPVYLPKKPKTTPLKSGLKKKWKLPPRKWTSMKGPEMSSGDTEYTEYTEDYDEDEQSGDSETEDHAPSEACEDVDDDQGTVKWWMFSGSAGKELNPWKLWFFILLITWVAFASRGSGSRKSTWGGVNESRWTKLKPEPEDFYLMMHGVETEELRKMTVMDYEIARWTDVDPRAMG